MFHSSHNPFITRQVCNSDNPMLLFVLDLHRYNKDRNKKKIWFDEEARVYDEKVDYALSLLDR
jgi:hypothetical protein